MDSIDSVAPVSRPQPVDLAMFRLSHRYSKRRNPDHHAGMPHHDLSSGNTTAGVLSALGTIIDDDESGFDPARR